MSHEKEEGWWDEALPEAEDAPAAAWNAAAARGPSAVTIAGATGEDVDENVNGMFDRVPAERRAGGAPVYRRRGVGDRWLLLAFTNQWYVGDTEDKDAREASGWACTATPVAAGTLPHEVLAGGWEVVVDGKYDPQPAVAVRGVTKAEADRLEAEALANAETDDDAFSMGKGTERIYAIASTGSEVTPEVFGIGLVGSIIWNSVMGFIIGLLMPILALSSNSHNLWDFQGAYETLINICWIIPTTTLLGAVYGALNYGKRAVALRRGKADYLASQEDA
ncbi:MAG: hypothetical protein VX264_11810 [Chloroflexota bacterium]|nr:hypothetical protein [Chloroflexota bacterium]